MPLKQFPSSLSYPPPPAGSPSPVQISTFPPGQQISLRLPSLPSFPSVKVSGPFQFQPQRPPAHPRRGESVTFPLHNKSDSVFLRSFVLLLAQFQFQLQCPPTTPRRSESATIRPGP